MKTGARPLGRAPERGREECLFAFGDEVVDLHFYGTAEFGVEASGGGVVDGTDAVGEEGFVGCEVVHFLHVGMLLEPCEDGERTVFGECVVAVDTYLLGVFAGVVVLAGGEAFELDEGDSAVVEDFAESVNWSR